VCLFVLLTDNIDVNYYIYFEQINDEHDDNDNDNDDSYGARQRPPCINEYTEEKKTSSLYATGKSEAEVTIRYDTIR